MNVIKAKIFNRQFRESAEKPRAVCGSRHIADKDILKLRGPLTNWLYVCFCILHIHYDCLIPDVPHNDIADPHILHHTTSSSGGLQPDSPIRSIKHTVGDNNIFYSPRHLATNNYSTVAT